MIGGTWLCFRWSAPLGDGMMPKIRGGPAKSKQDLILYPLLEYDVSLNGIQSEHH